MSDQILGSRCRSVTELPKNAVSRALAHDLKKGVDNMDRRIKKAIQIMLHDTRQRVQIRELAQQVNLSPGRFSKLFKVETCLTPNQFVRYWRLRQARELLDQSFLKVNEIATTVGFRHLSSFTREFKNLYGYPPSVSRGAGRTGRGFSAGQEERHAARLHE